MLLRVCGRTPFVFVLHGGSGCDVHSGWSAAQALLDKRTLRNTEGLVIVPGEWRHRGKWRSKSGVNSLIITFPVAIFQLARYRSVRKPVDALCLSLRVKVMGWWGEFEIYKYNLYLTRFIPLRSKISFTRDHTLESYTSGIGKSFSTAGLLLKTIMARSRSSIGRISPFLTGEKQDLFFCHKDAVSADVWGWK